MIHLIEGSEPFLRAEAVAAVIAPGDDVCPVPKDAALACLLDEARTLSLFGRRVVYAQDGAQIVNENAEALARSAGEDVTLVLEAVKFDRRRKGMKALLKAARVTSCEAPENEAGLLAFVRRRARHHGATFAPGVDVNLIRRLGGHGITLGALDSEVAKLALSPGPITNANVEALVGSFTSVDSFALVNAVASLDARGALWTLATIFKDGAMIYGKREREPTAIALPLLGALRWDLCRRFREGRISRDWLQACHAWLRQADGAIKRGADPDGTLTVLVARMARPNS